MMTIDYVQVLAVVVCFLALIVTFKQVDLQIRINNLFNLQLKANKEKKKEQQEKRRPRLTIGIPINCLGQRIQLVSILFAPFHYTRK
ncbi:hypothetical protein [Brevibacillus brevis]|uniref:hypothetical protein n=1 Tax=Brevibacillus brevis TaxID=1393 RepID=UPI0037C69779